MSKKLRLKECGAKSKMSQIIFETNSSFHIKQHIIAKLYSLFFKSFLLVITNFHFDKETGY